MDVPEIYFGNIAKELLREIIAAFLNGEMDSELLKLKILEAISNGNT